MRKGFQVAALASALSLVAGSSALAAGKNELTFGGWSASNGDINTAGVGVCAANFDCSVVAEGKGFKQLQLTSKAGAVPADEVGVTYIMTIVTDPNATGDAGSTDIGFEDVSFVQMKVTSGGGAATGNINGIYSQQKISESVGTTEFISGSNISTGWAENITSVKSPVSISQVVRDLGPADSLMGTGDDFKSTFFYASSNDDAGVRDGFAMSISQTAGLATPTSDTTDDVQVFAFRERQGSMLTSASPIDDLGVDGLKLNGGAISWVAGVDDVKATWIGQKIALGSGTGSVGGDFGFLSFQNTPKTGEASAVSSFGFSTSDSAKAAIWDQAFIISTPSDGNSTLTAPCIEDPTGRACPTGPP